jgi:hypothetical protein
MKVRFLLASASVAVGTFVAIGCRSSEPQPANAPVPTATPQTLSDAAAVAALGTPAAKQLDTAVEFEKLIALLPEGNGWTRSKPKGEQVSVGGAMSVAKAEYQKGDASIDLEITDSSFNQLVLSPITMFLAAGYSERSGESYSKSASIAGNPGFEKWNDGARRGEVTVVIGKRFIVQATGRNVDDLAPVRSLVKALDFGRLASLK